MGLGILSINFAPFFTEKPLGKRGAGRNPQ